MSIYIFKKSSYFFWYSIEVFIVMVYVFLTITKTHMNCVFQKNTESVDGAVKYKKKLDYMTFLLV